MISAKINQPVSAFQALGARYLVVTTVALFTLAIVLAIVPRQVFQSELVVGISRLIITHWPKLEADWYSLLRINPGFADKFVVSYTVLVFVAALMLVICSLHLLVKAIRDGDVTAIRNGKQIRGVLIDTKRVLSGVFLVLLCGWWSLLFPTPFMDMTKYPRSEMALIYSIPSLSLLWIGLAGFAAAAISFLYGSHSNNTAKSDSSTARPRL